jgi:hypothetical protein
VRASATLQLSAAEVAQPAGAADAEPVEQRAVATSAAAPSPAAAPSRAPSRRGRWRSAKRTFSRAGSSSKSAWCWKRIPTRPGGGASVSRSVVS